MAEEFEVRISELPQITSFNANSLIEIASYDHTKQPMYESAATTINDLALKVATEIGFAGDLETNDKKLIGAINEIYNLVKNYKYADVSENADFDFSIVDNTKTHSLKVIRYGNVVCAYGEFTLLAPLSSGSSQPTIATGLPKTVQAFPFVAVNTRTHAPVMLAVTTAGTMRRHYEGTTAIGDTIRYSVTYITN